MRLVQTAGAMASAIAELEGASEIALDTEFHTERTYWPQLMLVQARADRGEPLLFDPLRVSMAPVARVLSERPVVVHAGQQDIGIVYRMLGVAPKVVFDTQLAAAFAGAGWPKRLSELTERFCGLRLEKGETLSDWSRRPLSELQMRYAADDVMVLPDLVAALRAELARLGRTAMFEDALGELIHDAITPVEPTDAWRRVPGAHVLDDAQRGTLAVLAAWRERAARDRDVGRNSVASDAILLDLARRQPESVQDMRANRRMPGHLLKQEAEAILEAMGTELRVPALPDRNTVNLLRSLANGIGRAVGVAGEWLLPEDALGSAPYGESLKDWRKTLLGAEFMAFIQGKSPYSISTAFLDGTIS